jgi:signal transduction histidine kinase
MTATHLVYLNINKMTENMNMIKKNESKLGGDVFYGNITINNNNVMVSDLIKNEEHNFRMTTKCKAGFQVIRDYKGTVEGLIDCMGKHTTVVEMERKYDDGTSNWFHVFATKGSKWYTIDKAILEALTVGDMHQSFSKMVDWAMWKQLNTKTWASMAFVMNK